MENKFPKPLLDGEGKKNLILVAGLPGSGKTTISKILEERLGGIHIELDEPKRKIIPREVMLPCASEGRTSPYPLLRQVYQHACDELSRLVENSDEKPKFIIIDECFHSKEFRDMLCEAGESLGYNIWFVEVICSDEDIVKARLTGDQKRTQELLIGFVSTAPSRGLHYWAHLELPIRLHCFFYKNHWPQKYWPYLQIPQPDKNQFSLFS